MLMEPDSLGKDRRGMKRQPSARSRNSSSRKAENRLHTFFLVFMIFLLFYE
jgi:hypothetical protein